MSNENNFKEKKLKEKLDLMKEDYDNEWWRPSSIDDYNLKNKLLRVGCRPLLRKLNKCMIDEEINYKKCENLQNELKKCEETLYLLYYTAKQEEIKLKKEL